MSEPTELDLSRPRKVHVVAIGGAGMSAIAMVLHQLGHEVRGSDLADGPGLGLLRAAGVDVRVGHHADQLADAELVVVSTAVPSDNPEVVEAHRRGVPVLGRVEVLSALARHQPLLSVSGTHGKTTTTSMLAVVMQSAGTDPSFIVGAHVPALGAAAAAGGGRYLVLEADESDASFLAGPRHGALVTNVEADHLEFWGGWDALQAGFADFVGGTDGPVVVCLDDPGSAALAHFDSVVGYGRSSGASYRIASLEGSSSGSEVQLVTPQGAVTMRVRVPGLHNALNAAGAVALAVEVGVDPSLAASGIGEYTGAARRFDRRGAIGGVDFVDDYAHLPTEVRAAISAGRSGGWDRVVVTFQPHRYSRTEALWQEFAAAFADADELILTEIYAAGESPREGVSGRLLVEAVERGGGPAPVWCPELGDAADHLASTLRPGDLCLSLGAGDVTNLADMVAARWNPGSDEQHA